MASTGVEAIYLPKGGFFSGFILPEIERLWGRSIEGAFAGAGIPEEVHVFQGGKSGGSDDSEANGPHVGVIPD